MNYNYTCYAVYTGDVADREKMSAEMDRYKEHAKKHGFKMTYWGHPYGLSETMCIIFNSENPLGDWQKMNMAYTDLPVTGQRTILSAR